MDSSAKQKLKFFEQGGTCAHEKSCPLAKDCLWITERPMEGDFVGLLSATQVVGFTIDRPPEPCPYYRKCNNETV